MGLKTHRLRQLPRRSVGWAVVLSIFTTGNFMAALGAMGKVFNLIAGFIDCVYNKCTGTSGKWLMKMWKNSGHRVSQPKET